ncbi:NAD(+)/NADH kinase, partial [Candidatus Woesearchaeota archaeon]|nr:NAD(+)/NADH kinase [Candidatus Woesearchaeota archaeon]
MKLENVLLATKQTALEYFRREYDDLKEVLSEEDLKNICQGHKNHYASFEHIKKVLESRNIQYQRVYMPYAAFEEFTGRDLVVSVGGDGTVLNTARYILDKTPLLTVKSDSKSVGALCTIRAENFEETLERILNGNFGIQNWTRAEGKFGNKTDLALNEIFVGHKYNAGASRYEISFD